ncbi:MAG: hypothetical protein ACLFUX_03055 [Spirochaetaceae bacterium]
MRAAVRISMAGLLVFFFSSCLDVETRIDLEEDDSGRMTVSYKIENELWDLGVFDSDSRRRAVPVTEGDFRRTARRTDGLELRDYERTRGEETTAVRAELAFSDLAALNGAYAPGRALIETEEVADGRVYRQALRTGEEYRVKDQELLRTFFEDYRIIFEVAVPEPIESANHGKVLDGDRAARLSLDIVEFLNSTDELTWEIRF